jgi:very-short-patch-repair endonuclease
LRRRDILSGQIIDPATALRARQLRHPLTGAERVLWHALHANRLHGFHFRRQQIVSGFIVDFSCHAARLAVEVDGTHHLAQAEADQERDAILAGLGLTILRVTNDAVIRDLNSVLSRITSLLPASASSPAPTTQPAPKRTVPPFPAGEGGQEDR